eukprot:4853941-Amphidinium_carterae.2
MSCVANAHDSNGKNILFGFSNNFKRCVNVPYSRPFMMSMQSDPSPPFHIVLRPARANANICSANRREAPRPIYPMWKTITG